MRFPKNLEISDYTIKNRFHGLQIQLKNESSVQSSFLICVIIFCNLCNQEISCCCEISSFIENLPAFPTEPRLFLVFQNAVPDPNRFVALLAQEGDIGDMERRFLLHNPSSPLLAMGSSMFLDEINLFNDHFFFLGKDLQDSAALALFLSADHCHQVILFNMKSLQTHLKFRSPCQTGL